MQREFSSGRAIGRWAAEVIFALLFFAIAAEQLAHPFASSEPQFRLVAILFALGMSAVGLAPLLLHVSPRLLIPLGALLVVSVLGFVFLAILHQIV